MERAMPERSTARPDPDDPRKPDAPTDLDKRSWKGVLKRTFLEFKDDNCTDWAAALTYYGVLAIFPAAIALLSLIGLVGDPKKTTDSLMEIVDTLGPSSATETFSGPIEQIASRPQAAGFALILGLAAALWSASGYVGAFGRATNVIYDTDEGRPFWKLRPLQIIVTTGLVLLLALCALAVVVTGPLAETVGDVIGVGDIAVTTWDLAKWPVIAMAVVLLVSILYYAAPNVRQPGFKSIAPGAGIALLIWIMASLAFGIFVANFASYNATYGGIAGVIVFLVWLWISNVAILVGAELNAELERNRELRAGIPPEETLALPPREPHTV
jgi:membrane protein